MQVQRGRADQRHVGLCHAAAGVDVGTVKTVADGIRHLPQQEKVGLVHAEQVNKIFVSHAERTHFSDGRIAVAADEGIAPVKHADQIVLAGRAGRIFGMIMMGSDLLQHK